MFNTIDVKYCGNNFIWEFYQNDNLESPAGQLGVVGMFCVQQATEIAEAQFMDERNR